MSDAPPALSFVDPTEAGTRLRVVLWAAPGQGKSVAAASSPGPILVVSADRPRAYRHARQLHPGKDIREVRSSGYATLAEVYRYLSSDEGQEIETVVLDPFNGIYEQIVDAAPKAHDGPGPNYQWVNKTVTKFLYSLRAFDVHVVIVAHERLSEGKGGDGKLYPALGGPSLVSKILGESDVVAHVEREDGKDGPRWMGQLAPNGNLVTKESTGTLGDRRELNLTEWFEAAADTTSDLPWDEGFVEAMGVAAESFQESMDVAEANEQRAAKAVKKSMERDAA